MLDLLGMYIRTCKLICYQDDLLLLVYNRSKSIAFEFNVAASFQLADVACEDGKLETCRHDESKKNSEVADVFKSFISFTSGRRRPGIFRAFGFHQEIQ